MTGMLGFFTDGWREIGRKANRLGLRRRLAAKDRDRQQALTQLGQTAWQSKLDLSAFAEQRSRLEQLDARAGDLSATTARLDTQRTELQARRQAEVDRFDALLAPAKAAQSQADTTLRVARAALAEKDRAIRAIEAQLAGLGKELAKPGDRTSAQGATGGSGTAAPDAEQRDRIATQQKALTEQAAADAAARRGLADDVSARSAESQQCAAETARLDAERKAALQPIDADLEQLRQAAAAATQQRASVGREQEEAFCGLGAALYERRTGDPALNERVQAVAAVDADRTATQAAIDGSLALTSGMARGTMAKFGTLVLLIPVVLIAAGYAAYGRFESAAVVATPAPAKSAPPAIAAAALVAADERRKDEAVQAFMKAPTDPSRRKEGIEILLADVTALGSAADRSSLPLLGTILARGEPELRAAAANAVGMIGPTATEAAALTKALNDPMPAVRDKVLHALNQLKDPGAQLLVRRVRAAAREGSRSGSEGFTPTVVPDAARLGTPLYPGAEFLAFASDLEIGLASFASPDPLQKVVDFYAAAAAARPPVSATEFTRLYFGGSAADPTGVDTMNAQLSAWVAQAVAAQMAGAEIQAEFERRTQRMRNLPLVRYGDSTLYGAPLFIAIDVATVDGKSSVTRYVVAFQDHALGRTGFEHHVVAGAMRK